MAETESLRKGTIEWLIYDVTDRLGNLNDLGGTSPTFDVFDPSGSKIVDAASLQTSGMECYALIDTTNVNFVPNLTQTYKVYLRFQTGPETPYLLGGEIQLLPAP
jgi:hypothetical protein